MNCKRWGLRFYILPSQSTFSLMILTIEYWASYKPRRVWHAWRSQRIACGQGPRSLALTTRQSCRTRADETYIRGTRHSSAVAWTIVYYFGSSSDPFIYAWFNLLQQQQPLANLMAKLGIQSRPPTLTSSDHSSSYQHILVSYWLTSKIKTWIPKSQRYSGTSALNFAPAPNHIFTVQCILNKPPPTPGNTWQIRITCAEGTM